MEPRSIVRIVPGSNRSVRATLISLVLPSVTTANEASEFLGYCLQGARRIEALLRDILACTQVASAEVQTIETVASSDALDRALANLEETARGAGAVIDRGRLPDVRTVAIHIVSSFRTSSATRSNTARTAHLPSESAPSGTQGRMQI
jgi:hypothetical protein